MQTLIATTFIIILAFSFINMSLNAFIFFSSRRPIYSHIGLFWLSLIINFFVQSQAQEGEFRIILSYGFTTIPLSLLAYVSLRFSGDRYPKKWLLPLVPVSVLVTVLIKDLNISFTAKATPFAFTAAIPLFYVVYVFNLKNRRKTTPLMKFHSLVLLLLALHSFNFAIFRMDPEAQLWGWPVAYALYQLLAALIPALTLDLYHSEEQTRLQGIIAGLTQDLKAAHQQALTSEKARIAADMHDELGAALTQIAILGEVAKNQAPSESQSRSTVDRMSQSARDATARMSELVWATNPRNDTLDNLVAYLREHAAAQFENTAVQVHLKFPASSPERHVSAMFRRNLLLVLKESLTNIVKHAKASEVTVQLEVALPDLMLRIHDNGRGFDPPQRSGAGNGLGNMQKRVHDIGGKLHLTSASGQGTQIEITLPLLQNS